MANMDHQEGFEREAKFHEILGELITEYPKSRVKAGMIRIVASHIAPDFIDGIFEMRSCERKLRFIGCDCDSPKECNHRLPNHFVEGEIYQSVAFYGAMYIVQISEDEVGQIGSEYFERVT